MMDLLHVSRSRCDANFQVFDRSQAQKLFAGRDIYLWGAGQKGRGFLKALKRNGFNVAAFIDSNLDMVGRHYANVPILHPDSVFCDKEKKANAYILAASVDKKNQEMFEYCEGYGLEKHEDFDSIQTLAPFYPTVEVTGVCNLRCISCPRGNLDSPPENGGYMSAEYYRRIVTKLVADIPFLYLVDLYVWGEPILNKQLPDIIRINNELGIASGISSNLNNIRHLEEVIKAGPAQLRVSLSGADSETYELTHTGGKWERLETNIYKLRELLDKHESDMLVEVYFHVYKHNIKDCIKISSLCKQLGFKVLPVIAMLFPDYALDHCKGKSLGAAAEQAEELLLVELEAMIEDAKKDDHKKCLLNRVLPVINWDGSVMACCNYSYTKIAANYLDIEFNELIEKRVGSSLCNSCQQHSLHRYFNPGYYADYVGGLLEDAESNTDCG